MTKITAFPEKHAKMEDILTPGGHHYTGVREVILGHRQLEHHRRSFSFPPAGALVLLVVHFRERA